MTIVRSRWTAQTRICRQLDEWCRSHRKLPRIGVIRCGDCGAGMATRWRSGGGSVKLGCLDCGLETDVSRGRDWKARQEVTEANRDA
jgi:hypothetical protein